MDTSIYRLVNRDAKGWWYHRNLRESGHHAEARSRERNSIKSKIETLRGAYMFSVGRGGWTIHYKAKNPMYSNSRLQGYGGTDNLIIQCCIMLGVPGYDVREICQNKFKEIWHAPMVSEKPDKPKSDGTYSGMMFAPVDYVMQYYRDIVGARVFNFQN